jgi:hypothetical protein
LSGNLAESTKLRVTSKDDELHFERRAAGVDDRVPCPEEARASARGS